MSEITDARWIGRALFSPRANLSAFRRTNRYYSDSMFGFSDTSLGGNEALNPLPQWNPLSDPRTYSPGSMGMGLIYSNVFNKNAKRAYFQFGFKSHNSLARFFTGSVDIKQMLMANYGEVNGFAFYLGYSLGFLYTLPLQAVSAVVNFGVKYLAYVTNTPLSKFYYMKPDMVAFTNKAQTIYNSIAVHMGVVGSAFDSSARGGKEVRVDQSDFNQQYAKILPDIIQARDDNGKVIGGVDLTSATSRYQRLANAQDEKMAALDESANSEAEFMSGMQAIFRNNDLGKGSHSSYGEYLQSYVDSGTLKQRPKPATEGEWLNTGTTNYVFHNISSWWDEFQAARSDGGQWLSFRLEEVSTVTDTFSNLVKASTIQGSLNSASSTARDLRFSLADGNFVGDLQDWATKAVASAIGGAASSIGLDFLAGIFGSSYFDIPKTYENSNMQVNQTTFKFNFSSPYGDRMSSALWCMAQLSYFLAAAIPNSTGAQGYTSPFLCKVWCQSITNISLGMITGLTVTRGDNNIKYSDHGVVNSITVEVQVTDLHSVMHAPIFDGFGLNNLTSAFNEENAFNTYLTTVSGTTLSDMLYARSRHRLATEITKANWDSWTSSSRLAQISANSTIGSLTKIFAKNGALP